jgi:hypothetical protein
MFMKRLTTLTRFSSFLIILVVFVLFHSCHLEPVGIDKERIVCFDSEILPMLKTSCNMCHDGSRREGFIDTSYEEIKKFVTPGNAATSKLYKSITASYFNVMPPKNALSANQRMLIEIWIQQGANKVRCDTITQQPVIPTPTVKDSICFVQDIMPLLASCGTPAKNGMRCHDAISHQDGYVIVDYATLMSKPGNIVATKPNSSRIFLAVSGGGDNDIMPPPPYFNPLTSQQLETFRKWIEQGALPSDCPPVGCDTTGTISYTNQIAPIMAKCQVCHGSNYVGAGGGVDLSGQPQIKSYLSNLRNGIPILVGAIRHYNGFSFMPKGLAILDSCSIRKIEIWIKQGAN